MEPKTFGALAGKFQSLNHINAFWSNLLKEQSKHTSRHCPAPRMHWLVDSSLFKYVQIWVALLENQSEFVPLREQCIYYISSHSSQKELITEWIFLYAHFSTHAHGCPEGNCPHTARLCSMGSFQFLSWFCLRVLRSPRPASCAWLLLPNKGFSRIISPLQRKMSFSGGEYKKVKQVLLLKRTAPHPEVGKWVALGERGRCFL